MNKKMILVFGAVLAAGTLMARPGPGFGGPRGGFGGHRGPMPAMHHHMGPRMPMHRPPPPPPRYWRHRRDRDDFLFLFPFLFAIAAGGD